MISIEIIKKEIEKFKILPQKYKKIKVTEMIPVYINKTLDYCNIGVFPALISNCYISQALDSNKWDLSYEDGYPDFHILMIIIFIQEQILIILNLLFYYEIFKESTKNN